MLGAEQMPPPAETSRTTSSTPEPRTDTQRWLKAESLKLTEEVLRTPGGGEHRGGSVPRTFLVVVIFWLSMTFGSFGLSAPNNVTVVTVFVISMLSVAAAVFLILELDAAFEGVIRIPRASRSATRSRTSDGKPAHRPVPRRPGIDATYLPAPCRNANAQDFGS